MAQGDQGSFRLLVDAYWQKVYGHTLAYTKSLATAEELTQDVFTNIWINRAKMSSVESFTNYLFIITRNHVLKAIRNKLEETVTVEELPLEEAIWQPDRQLEYRELYASVLEGIAELPPMRRRVFTMSRIEGMSYEQICKELGLSRNTVKEHIVKALNFLRNYIPLHNDCLLCINCIMVTVFFS